MMSKNKFDDGQSFTFNKQPTIPNGIGETLSFDHYSIIPLCSCKEKPDRGSFIESSPDIKAGNPI